MKQLPGILAFLFCFSACIPGASFSTPGRNDLRKMKWIEGNWSGLYKGEPFYEIYKLMNDTTLEIISYNWNGKDSSGTSKSYLYKKGKHYFLGDSLNWKVTTITDSLISMTPNYKASNSIVWKKRSKNNWDAILTSKIGETIYSMEKVKHFR